MNFENQMNILREREIQLELREAELLKNEAVSKKLHDRMILLGKNLLDQLNNFKMRGDKLYSQINDENERFAQPGRTISWKPPATQTRVDTPPLPYTRSHYPMAWVPQHLRPRDAICTNGAVLLEDGVHATDPCIPGYQLELREAELLKNEAVAEILHKRMRILGRHLSDQLKMFETRGDLLYTQINSENGRFEQPGRTIFLEPPATHTRVDTPPLPYTYSPYPRDWMSQHSRPRDAICTNGAELLRDGVYATDPCIPGYHHFQYGGVWVRDT